MIIESLQLKYFVYSLGQYDNGEIDNKIYKIYIKLFLYNKMNVTARSMLYNIASDDDDSEE